MKKFYGFLLAVVVALGLGLTACNNNDVPEPVDQDNGGHYLGISLKISSPSSTRATIDDDSKDGLPAENDLSAASAVVVAFPTGIPITPVVSNVLALAAVYDDENAPTYTPKADAAIEVAAGTYDVYVVVGPSTFISTFRTEVIATPGIIHQKDLFSLLNNLSDIDGLITANAFVLSSREVQQVTAQASKDDAIGNAAQVDLDRLVAKVTVSTATDFEVVPTTFDASLAGFTLQQGKTAQYTMIQDKALPSTPPAGLLPNDWNPSSPVLAAGAPNYISFPSWGNNTDAFETTVPGRSSDGGLYTTENTTVYNGEGSSDIYKIGTTTYALIRVKIIPTTLVGSQNPADPEDTFYFGLSDYKFYGNRADAAAANGSLDGNNPGTVGNNGFYVYKGGYAYYSVLVGQNYPTESYAPIVRNRWYELNVTKVLQLGTPYDPFNPENPKVPFTPADPDGDGDGDGPVTPPTPPGPDDPIIPEVQYIVTELTVNNWTAVNRDVELK